MIFDSFTPQTLRDAIEYELQSTDDAKTASIIALKKLNEDPHCYDMSKAKPTKYIKREGSSGHYKYFYNNEDGQPQSSSWLSIFASLFGFKDKSQAMKKIETDYKVNQLDKKYNLTWDGWKSHLEEYFLHKDKWTAFFRREKKPGDKKKTEKKETPPKPKKTEKKIGLQLSVMKLIHQLYGNSVPPVQKNNFETMPENKETENEKLKKEMMHISLEKIEKDMPQSAKDMAEIGNNNLIDYYSGDIDKAIESTKIRIDRNDYTRDYAGLSLEIYRLKLLEKIKEEQAVRHRETPEQKKADVKIATIINNVTPETRGEAEREILGIPEPSNTKDVEMPKIEFVPTEIPLTIPHYKGGGAEIVKAKNYTDIKPKDIYLINEKNILKEIKPIYIPNVYENYLASTHYLLPMFKLGPDKYVIKTDNNSYAIVNRDILAATTDYYLKLAKANQKENDKERKIRLKEKYGDRKVRFVSHRISIISENKMSYGQQDLFYSFAGHVRDGSIWTSYKEIRNDLKQKTEDMELQIEEYYNSYTKGKETSYGDVGTKDNLLNDYGVRVKRQNGAEINNNEITQIKESLDSVFNAFGNRASMAKSFGLKISHAGDKNMHARKAVGLFIPAMKAIGVSAQFGTKTTGFILSHEWGHFMDYWLGGKDNRHYLSDNPNDIAGEIADTFRKNMLEQEKQSKYQKRTCECFARALEQYWAIKTNNYDIIESFDMKNHPTREIFESRIMPLIDKFFQENNELLKAFYKNKIIKIRKL